MVKKTCFWAVALRLLRAVALRLPSKLRDLVGQGSRRPTSGQRIGPGIPQNGAAVWHGRTWATRILVVKIDAHDDLKRFLDENIWVSYGDHHLTFFTFHEIDCQPTEA